MKKRVIAMLLSAAMCFGLNGCAGDSAQSQQPPVPDETVTNLPQTQPEVQPEPETEQKQPVRFAVLAGPTGVGAAKLLADNEAGESALAYEVTVAADNQEIAGKLINGDLDIACMASNMAANLYSKSEGGIQALCLSTLGVLHILESGEKGFEPTLTSMEQLKGKTVYATGEGANPQYVLDYLLTANGIDPKTDVEIVWQSAQEVQFNLLEGKANYAMLPVPAATVAQIQSKQSETRDVVSVLDLTEEWEKVTDDSVLTMTTVVVRTEFAQENPEAVAAFLQEYQASIEYVNSNVEDASVLIEQFGIVGKAAVAKMAIPDCNLVYIAGKEMKQQIQGYYQVLFEANPAAVGGSIPDDGFYWMG